MTSRSRRSRRTTASRTTGPRTAISLAVLAACAAAGAAADPPAAPAPTKWNAAPPVVVPPAPSQPPKFIPPVPPPASDAPRMVLFQKPAEQPPAGKPTTGLPPVPNGVPQPKPASQPPVAPLVAQPGKDTLRNLYDPAFLTSPPTALRRDKVFQDLESNDMLRNRVVQELGEEQLVRDIRDWKLKEGDPTRGPMPTLEMALARLKFPAMAPPLRPGEAYVTKAIRENYPPGRALLEPAYVVHRKLLFEEQNAERFGWDAGIAQPLISATYFYKDVLLWPSKLASYPCERYDTSAGKCLPGYPVPYYIYPEEISLFGATVGAATIVGSVGFVYP